MGGGGQADYVSEGRTVLYDTDRDSLVAAVRAGNAVPAFEMAGPRKSIFFDPSRVKAAIVTCGGLCPGINNVIRTLVFELHYALLGALHPRHPLRVPRVHSQVRLRAHHADP